MPTRSLPKFFQYDNICRNDFFIQCCMKVIILIVTIAFSLSKSIAQDVVKSDRLHERAVRKAEKGKVKKAVKLAKRMERVQEKGK